MAIMCEGVKTYIGRVLTEYENNGSSDSDFFAIVWDDEAETIKAVEYGSTRHGGRYACDIDATPEVIAKAKAYKAEVDAGYSADLNYLVNALADKGKTATIAGVKGKNSRFNNYQGVIFWVGGDNYAPRYKKDALRIGIEIDGEKVFLSGSHVFVNNYEFNCEDAQNKLRIFKNVRGYHPAYRLPF